MTKIQKILFENHEENNLHAFFLELTVKVFYNIILLTYKKTGVQL